jgi:hypothetical protein
MPMDPQALAVHAHDRVRAQARRQTREWLKACLPAHREQCAPRRADTAEPTAEINPNQRHGASEVPPLPTRRIASLAHFMQTQPHNV